MNVKVGVAVIIILFSTAAIAAYYTSTNPGGTANTSSGSSTSSSSQSSQCSTAPAEKSVQLAAKTFGAITEYSLSGNRTPGGVAVAPDGSLWFGEWGLPGVAHVFTNGTLNEYRWPYPDGTGISNCGMQTQIWGVALWNGSVWGSDFFYSRLVGVNPTTGQTQKIDLANGSTPYTLAVSGDDNLWFTASKLGAEIGKVSPTDHNVTYYNLPTGKSWESVYVLFKNVTTGYVLALDGADPELAQVFSFNPTLTSPSFTAVGDNQTLYAPTGLTLGEGGLWATEHSASAMAFLNFTSNRWTIYPTSTVPYTPWVLTYFDGSNGTAVWFNEHYGNRMGVISHGGTQLTEYNVSNPPLYNLTAIVDPTNGVNMVTMGIAPDGAWFAAAGGFVGYVNGSYVPPFSITVGSGSVSLVPGGSSRVNLTISTETLGSNLSIQFSDNEFNNGTAKQLSFSTILPPRGFGGGTSSVSVDISGSGAIEPGTYLAAATLTDGSIYRSVYFTVIVT